MRPLRCVNHTLAAVGTCIAFSSLAGAQTGTDASVNSEELQEVVVTAEKVPQDAQKTARAVTVINSDELRRTGDTTLDTVLTQVPGVTLQGMFGRQIYIRGIGSDNDPTNADPPVVINVDGVSQMGHATALGMPTTGATSALLDVDNIQVVSGPEGVTQGRNALAGSVNINSHAPDLGKVDGYATVKYGNYNSHTYDAAVNLPIGDTLAIRVAGLQESHEGYIHSNYTLTPTPPPGGVRCRCTPRCRSRTTRTSSSDACGCFGNRSMICRCC